MEEGLQQKTVVARCVPVLLNKSKNLWSGRYRGARVHMWSGRFCRARAHIMAARWQHFLQQKTAGAGPPGALGEKSKHGGLNIGLL